MALYSDWVCPTFSGSTNQTGDTNVDSDARTVPRMQLLGLRHPLLEKLVGSTAYIPSDLTLTAPQQMCLITGPNMGGKSTFMRAAGLCCILAQIGSFVPATRAHLPIFDKLLVRIGAGDSVSLGVSTFMAEMLSVSAMLKAATPKSLALVDELGERSWVLNQKNSMPLG